jgi:hypothetical protein
MMTFPIYGKIKHVPNHQPDGKILGSKPGDVRCLSVLTSGDESPEKQYYEACGEVN